MTDEPEIIMEQVMGIPVLLMVKLDKLLVLMEMVIILHFQLVMEKQKLKQQLFVLGLKLVQTWIK